MGLIDSSSLGNILKLHLDYWIKRSSIKRFHVIHFQKSNVKSTSSPSWEPRELFSTISLFWAGASEMNLVLFSERCQRNVVKNIVCMKMHGPSGSYYVPKGLFPALTVSKCMLYYFPCQHRDQTQSNMERSVLGGHELAICENGLSKYLWVSCSLWAVQWAVWW